MQMAITNEAHTDNGGGMTMMRGADEGGWSEGDADLNVDRTVETINLVL